MIKLFNIIRMNILDWWCTNCHRTYTKPQPNNKCPRCGSELY